MKKYPFYAVVEDDFRAVNQLIIDRLSSHIPMVEEIANYLIEAGGKRLRPLLVLLSAKSCNYGDKLHLTLAAVIEFLHTAMLLHDDVVDDSDLRRGRSTVNAAWGNPPSVLVGDFLHSRAFEMMVEIGEMRVMEILSHATNVIAEGEVQQLSNLKNPDLSEQSYMEVIRRKTAMLFEAASHSGAVLAGADRDIELALRDYGAHLGLAFQLIDDVLDYDGETASLGKNVGDDLAEGKVTLPLIYAMDQGSQSQTDLIRQAIRQGGLDSLSEIITTVESTGALEYTTEKARQEREKAIQSLGNIAPSSYQQAMYNLVNFVVERNH
ncbi:MAG: polyprenyl synthetase family protein [Pseudomonadales bacterium]|nr:polyprenyl synthetase family protein [Pseudomonadales bacterium]MDP7146082.1 polyprenyl synthetase family protein [Pseudomonadales bacterium]MDP7360137.1 polyprenyl synthetase family protein [Pseudomonadales bacterium]MDP7594246.1 polyprenyl synthetase family protein [Pseudomonadales bacterium]HJN51825.1 polyprenyl synthetase family protein [Pseudomonadales bacterium]